MRSHAKIAVTITLVTGLSLTASPTGHAGVSAAPEAAPSAVAEPGADFRVIQANIQKGQTQAAVERARDAVLAHQPDFVSYNEIKFYAQYLRPPGYRFYNGGKRSVGVSWSNRWAAEAKGFRKLVDGGGAYTRWGTWVTLRGSTGAVVTVISTHAQKNPERHGRMGLYHTYMANLRALVEEKQAVGPVVVAGDFNSRYPKNGGEPDWWGPVVKLRPAGMTSTFDALGQPEGGWATHRGGGTIDYIFTSRDLAPIRHFTQPMRSDHHMLGADVTFAEPGPPADDPVAGAPRPSSGNWATKRIADRLRAWRRSGWVTTRLNQGGYHGHRNAQVARVADGNGRRWVAIVHVPRGNGPKVHRALRGIWFVRNGPRFVIPLASGQATDGGTTWKDRKAARWAKRRLGRWRIVQP